MLKHLIILLALFATSTPILAQPGSSGEADRFARIKAAKEAFLREELPLSEKEAAAFFPIYWRYEQELRGNRSGRGGRHGGRNAPEGQLTEAEAIDRLRVNRTRRREMMALQEKSEDAYLKILPATKVIRLHRVEREFREKLLRRLKHSRSGSRN